MKSAAMVEKGEIEMDVIEDMKYIVVTIVEDNDRDLTMVFVESGGAIESRVTMETKESSVDESYKTSKEADNPRAIEEPYNLGAISEEELGYDEYYVLELSRSLTSAISSYSVKCDGMHFLLSTVYANPRGHIKTKLVKGFKRAFD
ncbi:unnamed protein product [Dovyalis caffra]|uniref:Uncharacterized protein n=1 Tax=Dovyalis caffra TaxID=77055 RepID=A0AAV1SPZ6_9ROSI|nr:unnamed protein product [Dovyalis caffra]